MISWADHYTFVRNSPIKRILNFSALQGKRCSVELEVMCKGWESNQLIYARILTTELNMKDLSSLWTSIYGEKQIIFSHKNKLWKNICCWNHKVQASFWMSGWEAYKCSEHLQVRKFWATSMLWYFKFSISTQNIW